MSYPTEVLRSIKTALVESQQLPASTTIVTTEIDDEGAQSALRPPAVEITPQQMERYTSHNTNFKRYIRDENGNEIGLLFRTTFELPVQIDALVAEGDGFDERALGEQIRQVLYQYDGRMLNEPLPDPDDPTQAADKIRRFDLGSGNQVNDLTMTPALRQWRTTGTVVFTEEVDTTDLSGSASFITEVRSGDGSVIASQDESQVEAMSVSQVVDDELQFLA